MHTYVDTSWIGWWSEICTPEWFVVGDMSPQCCLLAKRVIMFVVQSFLVCVCTLAMYVRIHAPVCVFGFWRLCLFQCIWFCVCHLDSPCFQTNCCKTKHIPTSLYCPWHFQQFGAGPNLRVQSFDDPVTRIHKHPRISHADVRCWCAAPDVTYRQFGSVPPSGTVQQLWHTCLLAAACRVTGNDR